MCTSDLLPVWITLLYILNALILLFGGYFTYQTRHVTLPTLRDSREVYTIMFIVVAMAMVCLPILFVSRIGHTIKYATGSIVILLVVFSTLTLSFTPKVMYLFVI